MSSSDHASADREGFAAFLTSPSGLVLIGFLLVAGIFLWTEHRAHLLGVLVWLPLAACALMHLFHGHGGHGGHAGRREASKTGDGK
jgi:hypothetical protein